MNKYICDLHIHSKYSRATSPDMNIPNLAKWARIKGISLMGTGDFTHHQWLSELKNSLESKGNGIYGHRDTDFILSGEVSNIYKRNEKTRRIHNIIFAPDFKTVDNINSYLAPYGKLASDGRPILKLDSEIMVKKLLEINPDCMVVPAHIWTPYFSLFGSKSGFNAIEDCFGDQAGNIYAMETGLSSDPAMNWQWSELDRISLVSNSDAHSLAKIGREANVFKEPFTYAELKDTLKNKDKENFLYTIEFFPEEGKYYWDGHRACGSRLSPKESERCGNKCPFCGKKATVGVMNRVSALSDRKEGFMLESSPYFKKIIPLAEIISGAISVGVASKAVHIEYNKLIDIYNNEFNLLLDAPESDIIKNVQPKIAKGIINVRNGDIEILPGYDGVFGEIKIFKEEKSKAKKQWRCMNDELKPNETM